MNILITGAWQQATDYISEIEKKHTVQFLQYEKDALPCEPTWVEGVICNGLFISHPIEQFTNLRYIQLTSAGYDRVPMDYVREHGIEIYNARGVYSIPMAEFAVCGVLQIYKQSRFFNENQKRHKWEKHRGLLELCGKNVCIIGCGDVGTECAKRFKAFGCRVIGANRTVRETPFFDQIVGLQDLDEILPKSDIVVISVALSEQTHHLLNAARLKSLKTTAVIANIARGAVVDFDAFTQMADRLCGAVLDVFEQEPLPEDSPLWDMKNVLITPHNSFAGDGNAARLWEIIRRNLK